MPASVAVSLLLPQSDPLGAPDHSHPGRKSGRCVVFVFHRRAPSSAAPRKMARVPQGLGPGTPEPCLGFLCLWESPGVVVAWEYGWGRGGEVYLSNYYQIHINLFYLKLYEFTRVICKYKNCKHFRASLDPFSILLTSRK